MSTTAIQPHLKLGYVLHVLKVGFPCPFPDKYNHVPIILLSQLACSIVPHFNSSYINTITFKRLLFTKKNEIFNKFIRRTSIQAKAIQFHIIELYFKRKEFYYSCQTNTLILIGARLQNVQENPLYLRQDLYVETPIPRS